MQANVPIAEVTPLRIRGAARDSSQRSGWSNLLKQVVQWALVLSVALASYFIVGRFFLQTVRVTGVSMQPTLRHEQVCFLNRWIYYVRTPTRGDIVVLRDPQDGTLAVKRIVGLPGDKVEFRSHRVFLNGKPFSEPYLGRNAITYPGPNEHDQTLNCLEDQFVVLGDNRMNSADSRNYGPVTRERILGQIR